MFYNSKLNPDDFSVTVQRMIGAVLTLFSRGTLHVAEPLCNNEGMHLYKKVESHWTPQLQDHLEADVPSASIDFTFVGEPS